MRLIDADAFEVVTYTEFPEGYNDTFGDGVDWILEKIDRQPTIEERKTGQWIKNDNGTWSCDQCQSWVPDEQHYYARFCLFCGAKMKDER